MCSCSSWCAECAQSLHQRRQNGHLVLASFLLTLNSLCLTFKKVNFCFQPTICHYSLRAKQISGLSKKMHKS